MSPRSACAALLLVFVLGCGGAEEGFDAPTLDQRLASGQTIKVTACHLVWGVEHGERHTNQDSFSLEYVTSIDPAATAELEREGLAAFELIRPVSEQWGFTTATVSAFRSSERTGKYDIFVFTRASDGRWSSTRTRSKVYNTKSGDKPGHE